MTKIEMNHMKNSNLPTVSTTVNETSIDMSNVALQTNIVNNGIFSKSPKFKNMSNFKIHGRTMGIKLTKSIYFHCGTDLPVWSYALAYGSCF